jgi:hypothetical protein
MATGKIITRQQLQEWTTNFRNNRNLDSVSNSASISLNQLESFIAEAKATFAPNPIAGFRIYFIRYPFPDNAPDLPHLRKAGNNVSQTSLVFVPLGSYNPGNGAGNDLELPGQNTYYAMTFATAETDPSLCPPKCGQ